MKALACLLFVPLSLFSQSNDILGISRTNIPNNVVHLAKIDVFTGQVQDITTNSYS